MFEKGIVTRKEIGRKHIYRSAIDKDLLAQKMTDRLIGHLFDGSPAKLAIKALSSGLFSNSRNELLTLQELIHSLLAKAKDQ